MTEDSVFTKIIKGEIPSFKIYEDELTMAILNIHPVALAHVLVIPKKQIAYFYDLPNEDYIALMSTVKKVAKRIKDVIKPKRVGLKAIGLDVDHTHIHVIGFDNLQQFNENEDMSAPVDEVKLKEMAKLLAF